MIAIMPILVGGAADDPDRRGRAEELGQRPAPRASPPRSTREINDVVRAQLAGAAAADPQRHRRREAGRRGEDRAAHARPLATSPTSWRCRSRIEGADLPLIGRPRTQFATRMRSAGLEPLGRRCACRRTVMPRRWPEAGESRIPGSTLRARDRRLARHHRAAAARRSSPDAACHLVGPHRPAPAARGHRRQPVRQDRHSPSSTPTAARCFDQRRTISAATTIVHEALEPARVDTRRSPSVEPYARPDGEVMLGAYAFPRPFRWAVLVERRRRDAYLAVAEDDAQPAVLGRRRAWPSRCSGAIALALRHQPADPRDRPRGARGRPRAISPSRVERGVHLNDEIGDLAPPHQRR